MSDKVDIAVRRLQEAAEMSQMLYEKPLVITYSGGKDSDTVLKLAQIAKIPAAFDRMIEERKRRGTKGNSAYGWETGNEVFHWWMEDGILPGQTVIPWFEDIL